MIIPALDPDRRFLREAVESVLAQTFENWELILVDDGSGPASKPLFTELASLDRRRIRCLEHPGRANLGISASRNLGIRMARGEYVAFLDADDLWLPDKLEEQVGILRDNPRVAMVYGNTLYWGSWAGNPAGPEDFTPRLGVEPDRAVEPPTLLPLHLQGLAAVPCPSSMIVRRSAAVAVGGFEASFRGLYEDQVFFAKICLVEPVFVSGTRWAHYRQHPDQMCSGNQNSARPFLARLRYLDWLLEYLRTLASPPETVTVAVERERWLCKHFRRVPSQERIPRPAHWLRRFKKQVLRAERWVVPESVSRRIWLRTPV